MYLSTLRLPARVLGGVEYLLLEKSWTYRQVRIDTHRAGKKVASSKWLDVNDRASLPLLTTIPAKLSLGAIHSHAMPVSPPLNRGFG